MTPLLVAGVGNVFRGDDAFGSEVARRLSRTLDLPGVVVRDFGIRTVDLAFALERSERAIVIDLVRRGHPAGTLVVLDPSAPGERPASEAPIEGHAASANDVLDWAVARSRSGAAPRELRIVGCEPADLGDDDGQLGLSPEVESAIAGAMAMVERVAIEMLGGTPCTSSA